MAIIAGNLLNLLQLVPADMQGNQQFDPLDFFISMGAVSVAFSMGLANESRSSMLLLAVQRFKQTAVPHVGSAWYGTWCRCSPVLVTWAFYWMLASSHAWLPREQQRDPHRDLTLSLHGVHRDIMIQLLG